MEYVYPFIHWFPSPYSYYLNYLFYALSIVFVLAIGGYFIYALVRIYKLKTPVRVKKEE